MVLKVEQETVIVLTNDDKVVRISTSRPTDLKILDENPDATKVACGRYPDGTRWGEYLVPTTRFRFKGAFRRRMNLTPEQAAARTAHLNNTRRKK